MTCSPNMNETCSILCSKYQDNECPIEDEVEEAADNLCCGNIPCRNYSPREPNNCEGLEWVEECHNYKPETRENRNMKAGIEGASAQAKDNAMTAINNVKDVVIIMQKGQAIITAVKAAIKKAPGAPEPLKLLMDTAYGDVIVGLILHTAGPILTGNDQIIAAVKAANTAGAVALSKQFTFISDTIEMAIASLPGMEELQGKGAAFLGKKGKPEDEVKE